MSDLADALLQADRATVHMDPQSLYGVASATGDLGDVADNATAAEAFGQLTKQVNALRSMSPGEQVLAWRAKSDPERNLLTQAGYQPPAAQAAQHHHKSLFGQVLGDIGGAVNEVTGFLGHEAGKVAHQALQDIGAPLRAGQHLYRASHFLGIEGAGRSDTGAGVSLSGMAPKVFLHQLDPSQWAHAWRETTHGEQTFDPVLRGRIRNDFGPDSALIERLAGAPSGAGDRFPWQNDALVSAIMRAAPADQRQALFTRIRTDTNLQDAVKRLQASKISVGRSLVGEKFQRDHPQLANLISGGTDALFDWYADPFIWGTELAKSANVARYAIHDAADVSRLTNLDPALGKVYPAVQRKLTDAAGYLADGDVAGLIRAHPQLRKVATELVNKGVTTPTELADWFRSTAGTTALLSGRASGLAAHGVVQMPTLSVGGAIRGDIKQALTHAVDFAADTPTRIGGLATGELATRSLTIGERAQDALLTPVGTAARRFVTAVPRELTFNPNSIDAPAKLSDILLMAMPRDAVDRVVNAFTAADTLGLKRRIWKGALDELGRAANLDDTPQIRRWWDGFFQRLDDGAATRMYSPGGNDRMLVEGKEIAVPVLSSQHGEEWAFPSFKDLMANSRRASLSRRLFGTINADAIDNFMSRVWKPLTLARLGFPLRVGGEEAVNGMLREGMGGYLRARGALGEVAAERAGTEADRLLPFHPISRMMDGLAGHLPDEVASGIRTPSDFVATVAGDRARRAFRDVEGKLATADYVDSARELWDNGMMRGFANDVSATHGRYGGYFLNPDSANEAVKGNTRLRGIVLAPTGEFKAYRTVDDLGTQMWQRNLDEIAGDPLARKVIAAGPTADREQLVRELADYISSPGFARRAGENPRASQLADGRIVGRDATAREAAEEWAGRVIDHVDNLTHDASGQPIGDLIERLGAQDVPKVADLSEVPESRRPQWVKGPVVTHVYNSRLNAVLDRGFSDVIGREMDWLAREPLFLHNFTLARRNAETVLRPMLERAEGATSEGVASHLRDVAYERAVNETMPFVHDPELRSQFAVLSRNLAPFWFAQEQFYKRWGRTFVHSPEAFRQAQLTMEGFRHSGIVHTDSSGNDFFMYPLVEAAMGAVTKGLTALGVPSYLPVQAGFSGQVKYLNPGLERVGLPSFGPLVGIPTHALATAFPELAPVESTVLGERGAGRSYWEQIMPTTLTRFVHFAMDNPDTSPQMGSAVKQAAQYLEATGHGLPETAGASERQDYKQRLKNWARTLLFMRMVVGYAAPAAPEQAFHSQDLNGDLRTLMAALGPAEGIKEFIAEHPDANAYTVFQSKIAGDAPLPATAGTLAFMAAHRELLSEYPQAAGWLIPQQSPDSAFSTAAYREQLSMELRTRKGFDTYLNDLAYAEAAKPYFDSATRRDQALAATKGNSGATQQIEHNWLTWKQSFFAAHPVFAQRLQLTNASVDRQAVLDQTRAALADPRLPDTAEARSLAEMVRAWGTAQSYVARYAGLRSAEAQQIRKRTNAAFADWAHRYVAAHPEAEGFYNRVLRPEVEPQVFT